MGTRRRHGRKDGRVGNPQARKADHPQLRIDHRLRIGAHAAGPDRVIRGGAGRSGNVPIPKPENSSSSKRSGWRVSAADSGWSCSFMSGPVPRSIRRWPGPSALNSRSEGCAPTISMRRILGVSAPAARTIAPQRMARQPVAANSARAPIVFTSCLRPRRCVRSISSLLATAPRSIGRVHRAGSEGRPPSRCAPARRSRRGTARSSSMRGRRRHRRSKRWVHRHVGGDGTACTIKALQNGLGMSYAAACGEVLALCRRL